MSDESVGLVRRIYETWNEQGPAAIRSMLAADVELHDAPEIPDAQEWRGRDAVVARLEAVTEAIGGGSVRFEGFSRRGDAVLVSMLWRLEGETSKAPLGEVFHLVEVVGGSIARIRVFLTESQAMHA
jgi:ketosteroid isomerase-like protein